MTEPWDEYLAAARRLDAVRHGAATAAGVQAEAVQAAHEELTRVRARLAPQQSRLRELGVPEVDLLPSPPERAVATRATTGGPEAVLAALRRARITADAADTAMDGVSHPLPLLGGSSRAGVLLGYGLLALAAVVLLVCAGVGLFMITR